MKIFLIHLALIVCSFIPNQNAKLIGTYKVVFDKKYEKEGFNIIFKESTYTQIMPDAVTTVGVINYEKFKVLIRKDKDDNPIEIDKREINKDTMKFSTKTGRDLSLTINRGMMIRVK